MRGRCWLLVVLSIGLLPALAMAEERTRLRLCIEDGGLPPYTSPPSHAQPGQPGLVIELVEQAARQIGVQVDLHQKPWKRCVRELGQGASDGIVMAIWQADRDAWGRYPGRDVEADTAVDPERRLWRVTYPILVRAGSALQWDGQRFSGVVYGVGAPLGYVASQRLQELGVLAGGSLAPAKAVRLVAMGRLDGYVLEREIAQQMLERQQLQGQLAPLPVPLLETDWYLPLSHQFYAANPALAERFWQALGEQRERLGAELARRYLHQP